MPRINRLWTWIIPRQDSKPNPPKDDPDIAIEIRWEKVGAMLKGHITPYPGAETEDAITILSYQPKSIPSEYPGLSLALDSQRYFWSCTNELKNPHPTGSDRQHFFEHKRGFRDIESAAEHGVKVCQRQCRMAALAVRNKQASHRQREAAEKEISRFIEAGL